MATAPHGVRGRGGGAAAVPSGRGAVGVRRWLCRRVVARWVVARGSLAHPVRGVAQGVRPPHLPGGVRRCQQVCDGLVGVRCCRAVVGPWRTPFAASREVCDRRTCRARCGGASRCATAWWACGAVEPSSVL